MTAAWRGAIVGAACGLAAWGLGRLTFFQGIEDWCQDFSVAARGSRKSGTKVVVVGIDDKFLREYDKPLVAISPDLAKVVEAIDARGARAVGVDLMVPETLDRYDLDRGAEFTLGGKKLGAVAGNAGNVVLPAMLGDGNTLVKPLWTWQAVAPLALVETSQDDDAILRGQVLKWRLGDSAYSQLALGMLEVAGRAKTDPDDLLRVDGKVVPLDARGKLRVNYLGPPGTVPEVPFGDVLAAAHGEKSAFVDQHDRPVDFKDAFVVVGVTARSQGDYHATPHSNGTLPTFLNPTTRLMSGPEYNANVLATMADGAYITTPWWLASLPQLATLGAVLGWAFARLSLARGFVVAFLHHWAWKGIAVAAFWYGNWRVAIAPMLLAGPLIYGVIFAWRWRRLRLGMRDIVKGDIHARLAEERAGHADLRGEERVVSVLFADIRGFTAYSSKHTPRQVVALLRDDLDAVVPVLESHGGMIDKYIGDGLMALFGALEDQPDHAARAARAAAAMVREVRDRAATWAEHDFPGFKIGVGVATGPVILGLVGAKRRLDYTAIGDTVNKAARIESANKQFHSEILICDRTFSSIPPALAAELGLDPEPLRADAHGIVGGLVVYRVPPPEGMAAERPGRAKEPVS
ncbi:MAG TPA: CHASE2 domain-containing protein [Isosphaeraceae bacterium]|jgi:adenylate cyclase|nr:CHASE2 domain-containing protein [Isosphaeraceae bacterium]